MAPATTPTLELNNGVTMPALGLGVYQSDGARRSGVDRREVFITTKLLNRETATLVVDNS